MTSIHHGFDTRNGSYSNQSNMSSLDCLYQAISLIETRNGPQHAASLLNNPVTNSQKYRLESDRIGDEYSYQNYDECKKINGTGVGVSCSCGSQQATCNKKMSWPLSGSGMKQNEVNRVSTASSPHQVASRLEKAKQLARKINDAESFNMLSSYSPMTPYSSPLSSPPVVNTTSQFGCFYPSQMLTPPAPVHTTAPVPAPQQYHHHQQQQHSSVYPTTPTAPLMSLQSDLISNLLAFYITQYVNTLKALNINQSPTLNSENLQSLAHLIYSLNSFQSSQQQQQQVYSSEQYSPSQFSHPQRFQSPEQINVYNHHQPKITKSQSSANKKFKPQVRYSASDISSMIDDHFRRSLGDDFNKYFGGNNDETSSLGSKRKATTESQSPSSASIEALKSLMNKKMKRSASLVHLDDQDSKSSGSDYKPVNITKRPSLQVKTKPSESGNRVNGGMLKFNLSSVSLNSIGSSSSSLGGDEESSQKSDDEKTAAGSATNSRSSSFNKALSESIWSSLKDKLNLANRENGLATGSDESSRFE